MDNFEIIIYILISLGWFLLQSRKKKKVKRAPQPVEDQVDETNFPTIEEQEEMLEPERTLLRELLGVPAEEKKIKEVVEEEPFFPAEEDKEGYERLKEEVKENKKKKEKRFDPYKIGSETAKDGDEAGHPIREWLFEDEDGPQKAIILSEVLKRKHF